MMAAAAEQMAQPCECTAVVSQKVSSAEMKATAAASAAHSNPTTQHALHMQIFYMHSKTDS